MKKTIIVITMLFLLIFAVGCATTNQETTQTETPTQTETNYEEPIPELIEYTDNVEIGEMI